MEVAAKVRTAKLGKSKSGSPQVVVEFFVTSKGQFQEQTFLWYGNLTPAKADQAIGALDITKKALLEMGWNGDVKTIHAEGLKKSIRLSLEQKDNGYWNAKNVFPLNRVLVPAGQEVHASELGALQAMMDGAGAPARAREPGDDDESPFRE